MRKLINSFITRLRGKEYRLDHRIPASYLAGLLLSGMMMAVRGACSRISHQGFLFVASAVTIKARKKIKFGKNTRIGRGTYIDALSTGGIKFGDNVSVGKNVRIECTGNLQHLGKGMTVGNNVGLGADNFFGCAGGIELGDDTILGNYISFHSENHLFDNPHVPIRLQGVSRKGIKVGKNCWIGARVTLLDGVEIGNGCVIAAGAVLTSGSYESNGIYAGVPAKLIGYRTVKEFSV